MEVYRELTVAVEEIIELYRQDGKELPPPTFNTEIRKLLEPALAA
ncbi:MAG: hypothetical protein AB7S75_00360 [Desulfococcaceae bacterium]